MSQKPNILNTSESPSKSQNQMQSPSPMKTQNRSIAEDNKDFDFGGEQNQSRASRRSINQSEGDFDFNQDRINDGIQDYSNQQVVEEPLQQIPRGQNNPPVSSQNSPAKKKEEIKRPVAQNQPVINQAQQKQLDEQYKFGNQAVIKWRNINILLTMFDIFLTVIFLQILAFGQNAVPQINDIVISKSSSLAYFGLSIFTIILLFFQYEVVSYGYKTAVSCWRFFAAIYGLIIIGLGIAFLIVESMHNKERAGVRWEKMSSNEKFYFENDVQNLIDTRTKNIAMMGAFILVVGIITLITAVPLHFLHTEMALKWKPAMESRLPQLEQHEQVNFVFRFVGEDDGDDHLNMMGRADLNMTEGDLNKNEEENMDNERDEDFLIQKDQQVAEQQMKMRFGAIPGMGQHDPYANYDQTGSLKNAPLAQSVIINNSTNIGGTFINNQSPLRN